MRKGLYANIHAKRARGEAPAKPGDEGYPAKDAFKKAAKTAKEEVEFAGNYEGPLYAPHPDLVGEGAFKSQYGDKTKLSQSSQRKSLGRGSSIRDGAKKRGYESPSEFRDSEKIKQLESDLRALRSLVNLILTKLEDKDED